MNGTGIPTDGLTDRLGARRAEAGDVEPSAEHRSLPIAGSHSPPQTTVAEALA
jgi:hypothetical protein